jgi:LysM repeat protein
MKKKHRRFRIVSKRRFISSIIILITLIGLLNFVLADDPDKTYQSYTVKPGDTIWKIAKNYSDINKDIRDIIYEIKDLNNLKSSVIYPNQIIIIPE